MNWLRRSTTTSGTTLIELSVVATIFLGITTVLVTLMLQNQRASTKVSNHTDTTAQLLLVFEKIRNEVRHSRIIGTDTATSGLKYWVYKAVNGIPQVTAAGSPDWLPGYPANPDVALLYSKPSKDALWRDFQGKGQRLAPMGLDGNLKFVWDAGNHTLTLIGGVGQKDAFDATRHNYQAFNYNVYLSNND